MGRCYHFERYHTSHLKWVSNVLIKLRGEKLKIVDNRFNPLNDSAIELVKKKHHFVISNIKLINFYLLALGFASGILKQTCFITSYTHWDGSN